MENKFFGLTWLLECRTWTIAATSFFENCWIMANGFFPAAPIDCNFFASQNRHFVDCWRVAQVRNKCAHECSWCRSAPQLDNTVSGRSVAVVAAAFVALCALVRLLDGLCAGPSCMACRAARRGAYIAAFHLVSAAAAATSSSATLRPTVRQSS